MLGFALATRNAATWARIVTSVMIMFGLCAGVLVVNDDAPSAVKAIDIVAALLSLVVIVLFFLPPTNKYVGARKARTA